MTLSHSVADEIMTMRVEKSFFGKTTDGVDIDLFVCTNNRGTVLKMISHGATVIALDVADRHGEFGNVVLGFDTIGGYETHDSYFGATIGRFGNRITGGRFELDGEQYTLAQNFGTNHLHGGLKGFDRVVWKAEPLQAKDSVGVRFTYQSPDGEEGYPGNLDVAVEYTLNNDNELRIEYFASTDARTVINLTNHSYWNLSAGRSQTILEHVIQIEADRYLAVDEAMVPSDLTDVAGTGMDLTSPGTVGERIAHLKATGTGLDGYDHNYVLRENDGGLVFAASVEDPLSGRVMDVLTTEPGVQFYSGNFLDVGATNGGYPKHAALCLETQHFPDSPNRPDFPSVVINPGEDFHSTTVHRFSSK